MKLLLMATAQIGLVGSMGALLDATFGVPMGWSILANIFFLGWQCHAWGSSYVGGLVEPDEHSSRAYIHFFRSSHLLFHRSTVYFAHRSAWKTLLSPTSEVYRRAGDEFAEK